MNTILRFLEAGVNMVNSRNLKIFFLIGFGVLASSGLVVKAAVGPRAITGAEIFACANKKTGALRSVPNSRCKSSEKLITWNVAGPQGAAGPQGVAGPQGIAGPQGVAGAVGPQGVEGLAAPTTTLAPSPTIRIGDTGGGGGIVFYVDTLNQFSFDYLEVAQSDEPFSSSISTLGCDVRSATTDNNWTSNSFGAGYTNTLRMMSACSSNQSLFSEISTRFRNGWFVPSRDEMSQIIARRKTGEITVSSFATWNYLTSSIYSINLQSAEIWWVATMGNGRIFDAQLDSETRVRLIRAG